MEAGTVSLVIPAFNEEPTLRELLDSVAAQRRVPDEVILVDAGSTDKTADVAASFTPNIPLKVLRRVRLHPGQARNVGAAEATGQWIAFTDAGIELDAGWLEALCAAMAPDRDVVFGSYDPVCDGLFGRAAAVAYLPPRNHHGVRGPAAVSMAVRREFWTNLPGFPPHRAAEDLIFFDSLVAAGARTAYAPGAVAHWQLASGVLATFRRFALYSEANLRAGYGRHWHRGLLRQYIVVALALALLLSRGWAISWVLLPGWFVARASRAAWSKRRDLPFSTLSIPLVAATALVLLVIDAATWVGALRYLWTRSGGKEEWPSDR